MKHLRGPEFQPAPGLHQGMPEKAPRGTPRVRRIGFSRVQTGRGLKFRPLKCFMGTLIRVRQGARENDLAQNFALRRMPRPADSNSPCLMRPREIERIPKIVRRRLKCPPPKISQHRGLLIPTGVYLVEIIGSQMITCR